MNLTTFRTYLSVDVLLAAYLGVWNATVPMFIARKGSMTDLAIYEFLLTLAAIVSTPILAGRWERSERSKVVKNGLRRHCPLCFLQVLLSEGQLFPVRAHDHGRMCGLWLRNGPAADGCLSGGNTTCPSVGGLSHTKDFFHAGKGIEPASGFGRYRGFCLDRHHAGCSVAGGGGIVRGCGPASRSINTPIRKCAANHIGHLVLDGDELRSGLNNDLSFSPADRRESARRAAEMAKLINQAGLIAIVALISPYRSDRAMARDIVGATYFIEIAVSAPLAICMARDPKGLYRRSLGGGIRDFTGISQSYEQPLNGLEVQTAESDVEDSIGRIWTHKQCHVV